MSCLNSTPNPVFYGELNKLLSPPRNNLVFEFLSYLIDNNLHNLVHLAFYNLSFFLSLYK